MTPYENPHARKTAMNRTLDRRVQRTTDRVSAEI